MKSNGIHFMSNREKRKKSWYSKKVNYEEGKLCQIEKKEK